MKPTLLSTGTASVGVVVEAAQLDSLPMSGRAPSSLIKLSAGVLDQTSPVANTRPFDNGGTSSFSMGGGPSRTTSCCWMAHRTWRRSAHLLQPARRHRPGDEDRDIPVGCSYGNSAAGTVNIVTKSGTNRFRGGAGYYNQPSSLSGTTFFTKRAGRDEPPFTYKQGGATAGGPLVIPGVIDGRNRVFWIASYDNIQDSYVTPVVTTVPTAAMRNGDFSELLGSATLSHLRSVDRCRGRRRAAAARPSTNNRIPADRINHIAKATSTTIRCRISPAALTAPATTFRRRRAPTPTTP